jgi:hypothetical protein
MQTPSAVRVRCSAFHPSCQVSEKLDIDRGAWLRSKKSSEDSSKSIPWRILASVGGGAQLPMGGRAYSGLDLWAPCPTPAVAVEVMAVC